MTDIAYAMLMLGNMDKAKEYCRKALKLNPGMTLSKNF